MSTKLFTPGPVGVRKEVLKELSRPILFHRTYSFEKLYRQVAEKLNRVFGADERYVTLTLTGSGTMANEAVITSLIKNKERLLIVSNGQFGERLATIAKINKTNFRLLDFGWVSPIDLRLVEKEIKKYKPNWLAIVFLETSVGMVNPVHEIGIICKKYGVKLFVDAVSALGAEQLSVIKDNIVACTSVPNKALEAPPGLSFVCIHKKNIESISRFEPKSYYLDLYRYYSVYLNNQTPTTPAVSLYLGLNKALDLFLKEGVNKRRKRYKKLSSLVGKLCTKYKISLLITDPKYQALAISTLVLGSHGQAHKLQQFLENKGFTVWHHDYGKKDKRLNSLVQISVMGDIKQSDIDNLFSRISQFLGQRNDR